jgi:hypothetical protein
LIFANWVRFNKPEYAPRIAQETLITAAATALSKLKLPITPCKGSNIDTDQMSGLEQIAAIVGLTEFGFRSIFSLYNAIKDLRNVPEEIESIQVEIGVLRQCLIEFQIQTADNEHIAAAVKRFGFPRALEHCEQACAKLGANLHLWTVPNDRSWRKRIGYFVHKKETGEVLTTIRTAKETIILTIAGSQL